MKQTNILFEDTKQPKEKKLVKYYLKKETQPLTFEDKKMSCSNDLFSIIQKINSIESNDIQEFFIVLYFNRANKLTGYNLISMGGVTGTVADPTIIVKGAAIADCRSVVLTHNHPSGNDQPSQADIKLTSQVSQALSCFDIRVLDHIITTGNDSKNYYSFSDCGLL